MTSASASSSRQAAPAHRLGRFGVQPACVLGAVGVDRDEHALAHHDRGVVRDRVVRLDLVAPPVGERGRAGAVRGDLLRDLVALEHVLEGGDLEAHLLGDPDHHQDLVGAVAVRVDEPLAFEDLDQRFELQVAARRERVGVGGLGLLVVLPGLLIRLGARERVADHVLDALPRDRVAARPGDLRLRDVLRVLAEGELDAGHRPLENQVAARLFSPQRSLITAFLPPIGFALPCRMFAVVRPPARSR